MCTLTERSLRVLEDARKGLYGCHLPLGLPPYLMCYGSKNPKGVFVNYVSVDHKPIDIIERLILEHLKIMEQFSPERRPLSVEDKRAMQIIEDSTRVADGRYEVSMLWKKDERLVSK